MVTLLTPAEFQRTDELWGQLKQTYGDAVALRRAKAQWAWARSHRTGTRVGGATGPMYVGANDSPSGHHGQGSGYLGHASMLRAGWGYLPGGSVDGAVAYRQFQQSSNPYDPKFDSNRRGTVTVEPLQPVPAHGAGHRPAKSAAGTDSGSPQGV